jgi:hypothetical protein
VEMLVVDNRESGTSRTRIFLRSDRETLELQPPTAAALRAGQTVEIAGRVASTGRLTVSHAAVLQAAGVDPCATTGEQKTAIILASFPSKTLLSSVTPALLSASFIGSGRTVDTFLRESSYGKTWLAGDVRGPFTMDGDYFDQPLAVRDAAVRAAAASAVGTTSWAYDFRRETWRWGRCGLDAAVPGRPTRSGVFAGGRVRHHETQSGLPLG